MAEGVLCDRQLGVGKSPVECIQGSVVGAAGARNLSGSRGKSKRRSKGTDR